MFKLTRPCSDCPFRKGSGETFRLQPDRLDEIFEAVAFQCHKTVDYGVEEEEDENGDPVPVDRSGDHPQQCAGLMSLLYREHRENQIMQVGERLGGFDPSKLDHSDVYDSIEAARAAHRKRDRSKR